jgi:hypothetical protein
MSKYKWLMYYFLSSPSFTCHLRFLIYGPFMYETAMKKNACAISDSMTIESFLLRLLFLVCASYKYKTEMKRAVMKHNWWNSNVVIYAMCDGSLINERYPHAYIVYLAKICGSLILSNYDSDSIWLVTGCDLNWLFNYYPSWSSRLS